MNKQDKAIADYLASIGAQFGAALVGAIKRDKWDCDEWRAKFTKQGKELETVFYTGTGHRKSSAEMPADIARLGPRTLARVEWEKRNLKPVAPTAACVLYGLIMDGNACDYLFDDWCADYGYDTDSRKALDTYLECQAIGTKLSRFFTSEQRANIAAMLKDY